MEHGGNLRLYKNQSMKNRVLDFSANINPLGIPDWVRPIYLNTYLELEHYPDIEYFDASKTISQFYGLKNEQLVLVNGIAEALCFLHTVLSLKKVILLTPSFSEYKRAATNADLEVVELNSLGDKVILFERLSEFLGIENATVYINNPQNPTGDIYSLNDILNLVKQFPNSDFVIDEAFIEFAGVESMACEVANFNNLIVLKSYTKLLALPGLRLGVVYASDKVISKLKRKLPSWNVNQIAAQVLLNFYANNPKDLIKTVLDEVNSLKQRFVNLVANFPLISRESRANFLLLECERNDAIELAKYLLEKEGIAVRTCESFTDLDEKRYLRVAIRPIAEQNELFNALKRFYEV